MTAKDWSHGYNLSDQYTAGFYRELAPNWLDFAALCSGHSSPRKDTDHGFHYLELGCGMGVTLCMLAALYPEGSFVGIDFSPSHINHATGLAAKLGLNNISFIEADLLEVSQDKSILLDLACKKRNGYHYICCHGVFSWVLPEIQEAILRICGNFLVAGGLFYCSYNSKPGWLGMSLFQHLVSLCMDRGDRDLPYQNLDNAKGKMLSILAASNQDGLPLTQTYPGLANSLTLLETYPKQYVLQEYANQGWAPLFFADMHKLCSAQKLSYIGSAVLPDSFQDLLPPSLQQLIASEPSPVVRQSIIDIATTKSFRRDVYIKGGIPLTDVALAKVSEAIHLQTAGYPSTDEYTFPISSGEIRTSSAEIKQLEAELAAKPRSIAELSQTLGQPIPAVLRWVALLLQNGRIHFDRSHEDLYSSEQAIDALRVMSKLILEGANYDCLPLSSTGNAISINILELMVIQALADGLDETVLVPCIYSAITSLGIKLRAEDGLEIHDNSEALAWLKAFVSTFMQERFLQLRALGLTSVIAS